MTIMVVPDHEQTMSFASMSRILEFSESTWLVFSVQIVRACALHLDQTTRIQHVMYITMQLDTFSYVRRRL